jgi:hypothetical protein
VEFNLSFDISLVIDFLGVLLLFELMRDALVRGVLALGVLASHLKSLSDFTRVAYLSSSTRLEFNFNKGVDWIRF